METPTTPRNGNQFDDLIEMLLDLFLADGELSPAERAALRQAERIGVNVALGMARLRHGREPRRLLAALAELDAADRPDRPAA